jgi:DNA-binding MarR family transcriptional regulator
MTHSRTPKSLARNSSESPTKISTVIKLLKRKNGATLNDITKVAGWQQHSVRAALTGLRKKGHAIERDNESGVSSYRIAKADQ